MTASADVIELDDRALGSRESSDSHHPHDEPGRPDAGHIRLEVASGAFGRHLGARLAAERRRSRRPLWVMATRSRGDFTVRDLRDAEAGLLPLDPDAVLRLADLYDVELRASLPPTRRGLEIGDGTITAGGVTVVFRSGDNRSMVEAYFRLVRTLRAVGDTGDTGETGGTAGAMEAGRPVGARHDDLVELVAHASRSGAVERTRAGTEADALQRVLMMASAEGRVVVGSLLAGVAALESD